MAALWSISGAPNWVGCCREQFWLLQHISCIMAVQAIYGTWLISDTDEEDSCSVNTMKWKCRISAYQFWRLDVINLWFVLHCVLLYLRKVYVGCLKSKRMFVKVSSFLLLIKINIDNLLAKTRQGIGEDSRVNAARVNNYTPHESPMFFRSS